MSDTARIERNELDVRKLLDRAEISDLIYRYVMGLSEGDLPMLLSIFSADARLDMDYQVLDGLPAITEFFSGPHPATAKNGPVGFDRLFASSPLISNILIDVNGDEARAESRGFVVHHGERDGRDVFVLRSLRFSDEFVRLEDGWKIHVRRHPHPAWKLELDERELSGTSLDQLGSVAEISSGARNAG